MKKLDLLKCGDLTETLDKETLSNLIKSEDKSLTDVAHIIKELENKKNNSKKQIKKSQIIQRQ